MTPYDIYRKLKSEISYVAPEERDIMLAKTAKAIRAVEALFSQGPNTEAGAESVEILRKLRRFEMEVRLRR